MRLLVELRGWGVWDLLPSAFTLLTSVVVMCVASEGRGQVVSGAMPPIRPILLNPIANTTPLPPSNHQLSLNVNVFEAYDDNGRTGGTQTGGGSATTPVYLRSGARTGGEAVMQYSYGRQFSRLSFSGHGGAGANMYSASRNTLVRATGGIGVSMPLGARTSVRASETARYAPYYSFGLIPGFNNAFDPAGSINILDPEIDLAITPSQRLEHAMSAGVNYQLSRRTWLSASYDRRFTQVLDNSRNGFQDNHVQGRLNHQLTRDMSVYAGYGYGQSTYGSITGPKWHNLDLGVNFARGLSFRRNRTTFSANVGSALIGGGSGSSEIKFDREHFRLTGAARINHELGRTWSAGLVYHRNFQLVDAFTDAFFVDTVTAAVGGAAGNRTTIGVSASYLHGTVGFKGDVHEALRATAIARYALTTWLSCYAQYHQYRFDFPNTLVLPVGFPSALRRRGVRAGAVVRIQLIPRR